MEELNPKQELFCRYYVQNRALFGNATLSYAEAYEYKLEELNRERPLISGTAGKEDAKYGDSEYTLAYNACSVQGCVLLRNHKVNERLTVLLNELLKEEVVDSELAKVIMQDGDLAPKVAAIKEFNKLKGRIIEKADITTKGEKINTLDPKTIALAQKYEEELKKGL